MKNKVFCSITFLLSVFALAGCKDEPEIKTNHHYTENYLFDNEKHWKKCTDEGCVQTIDTAIHEFLDWTIIEEPTCSKPGKEQSKCKTCDFVLTRDVPVIDHDIETTWTTDSSSHWHNCKNNPEEKVDFGNHAFKWIYSKEPTCTESGRGHQECSVCGYKLADQDLPALGHSWVIDEQNTTYATCTEPGVVVHKCSVCGESESKNVSAGHAWLEPVYTWSDDLRSVTATRVCDNNPLHIETETVDVEHAHVSPTCSEIGTDTYTTKAFTNTAFKAQQKVIELAKCSETLVHHCEAEKYTAGSIYDLCSVCNTKYNVRDVEAPWVDFFFPDEMERIVCGTNAAGTSSLYDADAKTISLAKTDTKGAPIQFVSDFPEEDSIGKNYFVMTYTLLENSSGTASLTQWWDTYLTIAGYGDSVKIRFGRINYDAVRNYQLDKATFFMDGEEVGWNGVDEIGKTGTVMVDITSLPGGVSSITMQSDGGAKLKIESAEFRSSKCDHDASCYKHVNDFTCAGLISTSYDMCDVCGFKNNEVVSELPAGYKSFDVGTPTGVRGDSSCYDNKNHVVTLPNTAYYGPMFNNISGTKLLVEFSLDWNDNLVLDPSAAKFGLYFMNSEGTMYQKRYVVYSSITGLNSDVVDVEGAAAIGDIAKLLDNRTGEEISTFERKQKVVLQLDISNASIKDFAKFLITGSQGSIVSIHNFIYC